nr:pitrilysin [uncultured Haemophilus sp.]
MKKTLLNKSIRYAIVSTFLALSFMPSVFAENHQNLTAISNSVQHKQELGFELIPTQINKSPNDKAIYQGIKLKNGMTVLLISDEKANKSLMSMAIPVGSMEDPISQQGLAHYLEHMILMGSKNFPETNSLDKFLNKNGGYNNASTTAYRTAYYLEVNNDAFDEAVARFADTFANSLLSKENAQKEVNAVNAEMVRAKSSDGHLLNSVNLATSNPKHPITKFTVGNNETLSDKPNSQLQTELEHFYQKYYSANLMKAVLYSNQPIEKLAKLAEDTLGKVENKNITAPKVDIPLFREQDKGVVISYKPIQPMKILAISFDMPNDEDKFAHKTGEYLAYIFNNNTDGTLSDYLIKQGLSDSGISASPTANASRNRGNFTFYVALTEKGLKEKDKIISLIFQQIDEVKKQGIQESYFNEVRESLKQEFAHLQVEKDGNYIESLAEQMLHYPLEHILDEAYLVENMDKNAIEEKLDAMNINNARILLISENAKTDKKSPYFEAGYSIEKITDAQKKAWLDFSKNPEIKLPELNPYFATDFSLIKEDKREAPKLIEEEKGTQIYAMPSQYFSNDPKARISVNFSIMPRTDNLKEGISATILSYMNELAQAKLDFQSSVAGMGTALALIENGLALRAEGYTQHLAQLIQDKLEQFSQFELNEKYLVQAKQRLIEALDGKRKANSLNQANEIFSNFANYPYFEEDKQREMIEEITLEDIKQIREKLLSQATAVRALSVGNLADEQVKTLVSNAEKVIKNKNSELGKYRYLDINESTRKLNLVKFVPNEDNALSIAYMAKGYDELTGEVRSLLLRDIISRWYFDDLRTNKQLGYVVYATQAKIGKTSGIRFMVQSPNTTPEGIMQHNERFFAESLQKLTALSEKEFNQFKESLLNKLERKPESISQEFDKFVYDYSRSNNQFDYQQKRIQAVRNLTKNDVVEFYNNAVMQKQGLVLVSQALGTKAKAEDAVMLPAFEKVDNIEKLQREFDVKYY